MGRKLAPLCFVVALLACSGAGSGYRWVAGLGPHDGAKGASASHLLNPVSEGFFLATPDGQASVQFPKGAVAPSDKELLFVTTIEPANPNGIGPAPAGYAFAGNAYTIASIYQRSQTFVTIRAPSCRHVSGLDPCPVTTPGRADALLGWDGTRWQEISARYVAENKTFIASIQRLGTFAGATKA